MKTANPNFKLKNIHEDTNGRIYGFEGENLVELFTQDDEGEQGMAGYVRTNCTIEEDGQMVYLWIRSEVYDTLTI